LKLETENLPDKLAAGDVLVKMLAAPIHPADLNMIEGSYPLRSKLPAVGGNEGAAQVLEVGENVSNIKVGDRVIFTQPGLGTWRSHGVFQSAHLLTVPSDLPVEYTATASINPCTAWRLLHDFQQLKEDDVIVQNGANSSVGMSVIQMAAAKGIKTINIIREQRSDFAEVVERLKRLGGYIVVSDQYAQTPNFARLLNDLPSKPKLALNAVGGESATEMARILGDGGTLVTYGGMSRKPVTVPTSLLIFKDIELRGFWLNRWIANHSREEHEATIKQVLSFVREEKLKLWMETWDLSTAWQQALQKVKNNPPGSRADRKILFTFDK